MDVIKFSDDRTKEAVEHGLDFAPKFDPNGLIPCITTDVDSKEILMVAYMNEESLRKTILLGEAVYFSRSRGQLWHKGESSGHVQRVVEMRTDCDQDAILLKVKQGGPGCCHVVYESCFYRAVDLEHAREGEGMVRLQLMANPSYRPEDVYGNSA